MNHTLLYLLMLSLRESHHGRSIHDILWLDPILIFRFKDRETRCIAAILSNPGPFCYVAIDNPLAGCRTRRVFEDIYGGTLVGVSVAEADCILQLDFSTRDESHELSLFLYGNTGSAVLTRENVRVVSLGRGGDRAGGKSAERNVISALVDIGQSELSRHLESESFARLRVPGLEPEMIDAFSRPSGPCDVGGLLQFRDGLLNGSRTFYLAARTGIQRAFPLPAPPARGETQRPVMGPFSNGTAAGRYVGEQLLETAFAMILDRRVRPIRKRIEAKKRLRTRLIEDLKQAQGFQQLRRETEALAAYQTRVPTGSASIRLPNPYNEEEMVTIELDPSIPVKNQIKKRFQKAAKLERSVNKITSRLKNIEKEIQLLDEIVESSKTSQSFFDAITRIDRLKIDIDMPRPYGKTPAGKEIGKTFRRFDIDKDWFVLVGRSNSENDYITFHLASPNDWWFHAQSVPGSHVVLKSKGTGENPPERVLLAAAAIAAYYSKSRHASLVPVIYTRRKYVRKPRRALPGKVVCEREKTLFAEPALPHPSTGSE